MKLHLSRFKLKRLACVISAVACVLLCCKKTTFAAIESSTDLPETEPERIVTISSVLESSPTPAPASDTKRSSVPIVTLIIVAILPGGAAMLFFRRHNVKVYDVWKDGCRVLVAKVRIRAKNPVIDLTPLNGYSESWCFSLEINKLVAKSLNIRTVAVIFGPAKLEHRIEYQGDPYRIEADFHRMYIRQCNDENIPHEKNT